MATRDYFAVFGPGNPATNSGLTPTFITFISSTGAAGTPPAISEPGSKGIYKFSYDASATLISFVMDGFTTGLATPDRYISGVLDPYDTFGVTLNAIGVTLNAIGSPSDSIGTPSVDPTTLFGFLRRAQEFGEGNATYIKASGILNLSSRQNTLIASKTIIDTNTQTTKA